MAMTDVAHPADPTWAWQALTVLWFQPVNLVLGITIIGVIVLLIRTQARDDVDLAEMLKDDAGKYSFMRLAGMGCFASMTWVLMSEAVSGSKDVLVTLFQWYGVIWSGSAVIAKGIEAWVKSKTQSGAQP
jgi:hypothetical protein